jgi:hypothetical protein
MLNNQRVSSGGSPINRNEGFEKQQKGDGDQQKTELRQNYRPNKSG